ncbi:hypothetical protein GXW83_29645 [Streptacidiphilus sp. PB12-B1b]|uniref:hypothetical protein n=1 Tax=Streptacidiphilus sp. PB12-B1b TaxID=2705012 RepID=UPI0015FBDCD8|nr:hypothetical protein [Streptacidiphilus sp. PB12-B1b]QMU79250.1 hypothetical protein GXW83_29645 [Streptacidiphilus sp. PB12-B1b]
MVQKSDSGTPPEGPRDPFAPPPKDAPDRPWQPRGGATRLPHDQQAPGGTGGQDGGTPDGGSPEGPGPGDGGDPPQGYPHRPPQVPPPHPWSPGYQGRQPPRPYGPMPQGPRFDPSDPVQRKARYALLSGMWGIFFMILGVPDLTLLLCSLALYWSISSLRGKAKTPTSALGGPPASAGPAGPVPPPAPGRYVPQPPARPQVPAATGGLIAAVVGLALFAGAFGVQMYYKNYYDCQSDALTQAVYNTCATSVTPRPPAWLVKLGG